MSNKRLYIVTVETEFEYAALAASEVEAESYAQEASRDADPDRRVYARRSISRAGAKVSDRPDGWDDTSLVYADRADGDITWEEALEIERQAQDAGAVAQYAREHQHLLPEVDA